MGQFRMSDERESDFLFSKGYELLNCVGRGGGGSAHVVRSTRDGQEYIAKVILVTSNRDQVCGDAEKEVAFLSLLRHPFIVTYVEHFVIHESIIIIMEYCNAGDLWSLLKKCRENNKILPVDVVFKWFAQMVEALAFIHSKKILHRDLKSANVFLKTKKPINTFEDFLDASVKIGDFGIARTLENSRDMAKTAIGTWSYFSPEVCSGLPYTFKSDIWALGCILFEMCALRTPFILDGTNILSLFHQIVYQPVDISRVVERSYPKNLQTLIRSLLNKDSTKRPSCSQLLKKKPIERRLLKYAKDRMKDEKQLKMQEADDKTPQLVNNKNNSPSNVNEAKEKKRKDENAGLKKGDLSPSPVKPPNNSVLPPTAPPHHAILVTSSLRRDAKVAPVAKSSSSAFDNHPIFLDSSSSSSDENEQGEIQKNKVTDKKQQRPTNAPPRNLSTVDRPHSPQYLNDENVKTSIRDLLKSRRRSVAVDSDSPTSAVVQTKQDDEQLIRRSEVSAHQHVTSLDCVEQHNSRLHTSRVFQQQINVGQVDNNNNRSDDEESQDYPAIQIFTPPVEHMSGEDDGFPLHSTSKFEEDSAFAIQLKSPLLAAQNKKGLLQPGSAGNEFEIVYEEPSAPKGGKSGSFFGCVMEQQYDGDARKSDAEPDEAEMFRVDDYNGSAFEYEDDFDSDYSDDYGSDFETFSSEDEDLDQVAPKYNQVAQVQKEDTEAPTPSSSKVEASSEQLSRVNIDFSESLFLQTKDFLPTPSVGFPSLAVLPSPNQNDNLVHNNHSKSVEKQSHPAVPSLADALSRPASPSPSASGRISVRHLSEIHRLRQESRHASPAVSPVPSPSQSPRLQLDSSEKTEKREETQKKTHLHSENENGRSSHVIKKGVGVPLLLSEPPSPAANLGDLKPSENTVASPTDVIDVHKLPSSHSTPTGSSSFGTNHLLQPNLQETSSSFNNQTNLASANNFHQKHHMTNKIDRETEWKMNQTAPSHFEVKNVSIHSDTPPHLSSASVSSNSSSARDVESNLLVLQQHSRFSPHPPIVRTSRDEVSTARSPPIGAASAFGGIRKSNVPLTSPRANLSFATHIENRIPSSETQTNKVEDINEEVLRRRNSRSLTVASAPAKRYVSSEDLHRDYSKIYDSACDPPKKQTLSMQRKDPNRIEFTNEPCASPLPLPTSSTPSVSSSVLRKSPSLDARSEQKLPRHDQYYYDKEVPIDSNESYSRSTSSYRLGGMTSDELLRTVKRDEDFNENDKCDQLTRLGVVTRVDQLKQKPHSPPSDHAVVHWMVQK
eukprot:GDKJ01056439.1.p1 GENE.GDKJ01056439.1~~GDKJ01056439.1.p1  ORF type:complete len:1283 (+),score=379.14 GDKJ01056439.1:1-3849(+)